MVQALEAVELDVLRRLETAKAAITGVECAFQSVWEECEKGLFGDARDAPLDDLGSLYTMQRERDVHDSVLGLKAPQGELVQHEDELDEILF